MLQSFWKGGSSHDDQSASFSENDFEKSNNYSKKCAAKLGLKENQRVIFEFTPEGEIKVTGEKAAPSFEDFWKQELAIVEETGKFDTGEMFFGEDLGEENIEW